MGAYDPCEGAAMGAGAGQDDHGPWRDMGYEKEDELPSSADENT
jgi:hypothetical protein